MDDFLGTPRRTGRLRPDPMGMDAPRASRAFLGGLLGGLGIGAGLLGGLFGGMSAKSRGDEYAKLFGQQQQYSRERGTQAENLAGRWGADTGCCSRTSPAGARPGRRCVASPTSN
jgi:hypothetical protein